jgi:DNA-directed RNA polymerase I, II, and III subunit RPABC1
MERFLQLHRTLISKLRDTGYVIPPEEEAAGQSLELFQATFPTRDKLERIFYPRAGTLAAERTPRGVLLFFSELEEGKRQIGVDEIRRLHDKMESAGVELAFFIANGPLSPSAKKELRKTQAPGLARVVVLEDKEIRFNVSHHKRAPKHRLLSPAEAKQWLEQTKLKRSQIPRIFTDDPMAKYYDAQPKDLMCITSFSPTVGTLARHVTVVPRLGK